MHRETKDEHQEGDQGDPAETPQAVGGTREEERPHRQPPRPVREVHP